MKKHIAKYFSLKHTVSIAALTLLSSLSLAAPQAVTFKDRVIGFDNVDVLGTTYNVRFTQSASELPVGNMNTLHTAKQAEAANEALVDLIKQYGLPVLGKKHKTYCKTGQTCRILSPYSIDIEFSSTNIWSAIKRFKADDNHHIIESSIRNEHTVYKDVTALMNYTFYAQWLPPEDY